MKGILYRYVVWVDYRLTFGLAYPEESYGFFRTIFILAYSPFVLIGYPIWLLLKNIDNKFRLKKEGQEGAEMTEEIECLSKTLMKECGCYIRKEKVKK